MPASRIAKGLNLSKKAIERFFRLIREVIYNYSLIELEKLSGELELDETMFGGKRTGKRGWGAEGKHIVFGIYQRNGKIIVFPVQNREKETPIPLIESHTQAGIFIILMNIKP
ncbi:MAG: transposase [Patescibacteria group bacterium]|nr:transposase [Patescibacteria group bacterium]